jgi:hypothetical protein
MVDANQPQGRSPITEVALVVSLKNNAVNSSVIPTPSATFRAGSAEGSHAACAAQAKPLAQDLRSIGPFRTIGAPGMRPADGARSLDSARDDGRGNRSNITEI